jgi:hypothetical protein
MIYAEHVERTLRQENNQLRQELREARLDLTDVASTQIDFQQRLVLADTLSASGSVTGSELKVRAMVANFLKRPELRHDAAECEPLRGSANCRRWPYCK